MKSVAIIGAGPGGLVAAKVLLRLYPQRFNVIVFEKQDRVGGLWALDVESNDKILNPEMPTNLSKYTVSFSDLSWNSVDLSSPESKHAGSNSGLSGVSMFPKAWQVGRYLETYARRYIPEDVFRLNSEVTHLSQDEESRWIVRWTENSASKSFPSQAEERVFDYALVASGFCSSPLPANLSPDTDSDSLSGQVPKTMHSSNVRSLSDLVPLDWNGDGDILVVGGTMSGVEAAASLALEISDRRHRPNGQAFGIPRVIHIVPRPFYVFPKYISEDPETKRPTFIPLDLCFYNLTRRPPNTAAAAFGRMLPDKAHVTHKFLQSKIGGDQSDLNAPSLVPSSLNEPPYIAIATGASYTEFVRSGHIVPLRGRVNCLYEEQVVNSSPRTISTHTARISHKGKESEISNIIASVYATGYTPQTGLDFISNDVKRKLEFDVQSHRLPLILTESQTMTESLPRLAFVGLHEGTYWGVEECQARIIATRWANEEIPSIAKQDAMEEERTKLRDLRSAIRRREADVPQLWNGDYVGLMEQCAASANATRNDDGWDGRRGSVVTARYTDRSCNMDESKATIRELQDIIERASNYGLFVSSAAFFALQGSWNIHRELKSALSTSPSGIFVGTATFEPRHVTDSKFDAEYLYIENGDFTTDHGFTMRGTRRYVYRYKEDDDMISAWFVKEDGKTVDYLFLDLSIRVKAEKEANKDCWILNGHHLCTPDTYDAQYKFKFRGTALESHTIQYQVKGPKKDYVSTAFYNR